MRICVVVYLMAGSRGLCESRGVLWESDIGESKWWEGAVHVCRLDLGEP